MVFTRRSQTTEEVIESKDKKAPATRRSRRLSDSSTHSLADAEENTVHSKTISTPTRRSTRGTGDVEPAKATTPIKTNRRRQSIALEAIPELPSSATKSNNPGTPRRTRRSSASISDEQDNLKSTEKVSKTVKKSANNALTDIPEVTPKTTATGTPRRTRRSSASISDLQNNEQDNLKSVEKVSKTVSKKSATILSEIPEVPSKTTATGTPRRTRKSAANILDLETVKNVMSCTAKMSTKGSEVESKETSEVDSNETSEIESKENSEIESKENSEVESKETSIVESKETSEVKSKETSKVKSKETSKVESKETSKVESKETSKVESKETSKVESKETSEVDSKETSEVDSKETIEIDSKETSDVESKETSEANSRKASKTSVKDSNSDSSPKKLGASGGKEESSDANTPSKKQQISDCTSSDDISEMIIDEIAMKATSPILSCKKRKFSNAMEDLSEPVKSPLPKKANIKHTNSDEDSDIVEIEPLDQVKDVYSSNENKQIEGSSEKQPCNSESSSDIEVVELGSDDSNSLDTFKSLNKINPSVTVVRLHKESNPQKNITVSPTDENEIIDVVDLESDDSRGQGMSEDKETGNNSKIIDISNDSDGSDNKTSEEKVNDHSSEKSDAESSCIDSIKSSENTDTESLNITKVNKTNTEKVTESTSIKDDNSNDKEIKTNKNNNENENNTNNTSKFQSLEINSNKMKAIRTIPRGKPKSGRWWKPQKERFSSTIHVKPLKTSWAKKMQLKNNRKEVMAMQAEIRAAKQEKWDKLKERQRLNKERQEINSRKSEVVQIITDSTKIKRMKKKQLRKIEKRDTNPQ